MAFQLSQIVSEPSIEGTANDDCGSWIQLEKSTYAWAIDGATSVADRNYVDAEAGDVAWFANSLSDAIRSSAECEVPPKLLHDFAIAQVAQLYSNILGDRLTSVPIYARPLAAVTMIRIAESSDGLRGELFYLADCPAFTLSQCGKVQRITVSDTADAEAGLQRRVISSQGALGFSPKQIMVAQSPYLRDQRERQLSGNSFAVSTPAVGAVFSGIELTVDLSNVSAIVLMTDGYERYASQYGLGNDESMIKNVIQEGAESVLRRIRSFERADPACSAIPRLKPSDDATCLVLSRTEDILD